MEQMTYTLSMAASVPFNNKVDYCVGTGRMGLALQKEYQEQLKLVQEYIGFKHIRGHGLFHEDMSIYQEYRPYMSKAESGDPEYNFTYLDFVMDSYIELGLRPFLELGFMPKKLASDKNTIFYWQSNTTPPKDYDTWKKLVQVTLRHLIERYGRDDVTTWPIEVWNEPNLPGFWKNADMPEYFRLFDVTFAAVKEVDPSFRVGGPAVCGGTDELWINSFLAHCREVGIKPDFITRHHYTTEMPDRDGHYSYQALSDPERGFANLHTTREIIDSYEEFRGLEIHITEFNTSYCPNNPIHDTNQNAAYIAHQLSRLGDDNESYSYWTFGDIFEEAGVPFTPFHGGFGLVANGGIPKPTFWTFAFFKRLAGQCIHRSDDSVVVRMPDGSLRGVIWNHGCKRTGREIKVTYEAELPDGDYCLTTQTVDEQCCNPLKVWHDMGEPSSLSADQKKLLKNAARPAVGSRRLSARGGALPIEFALSEFAVVYFELTRAEIHPDRGYSYERSTLLKEDNN